MIKIVILGAAAGGGVPQWNCGCANCRDARTFRPELFTNQASIAISADGENWFLLNASPDLRHQIAKTPTLWPEPHKKRHSPIAGVVLTNGEIDAITGLLTLREGSPFTLYAHERVLSILKDNSIFNALRPEIVDREPIEIDMAFTPRLTDGLPSGLTILPFAAPGKTALFREGEEDNDPGDTLGLVISDEAGGKRLVYLAACARLTPEILELVENADALFFDGTLWRDNELIAQGLGHKTGQRMGHIAMEEAIAGLAEAKIGERLFLHINNSNPALRADSKERKTLEAAGWTIPAEGMEMTL